MNKIKFCTFNFDDKIKVLISISIIIAITIICYSFYYICIRKDGDAYNYVSNEFSIEEVNSFNASFCVTIYSNKNVNRYSIDEEVNKQENTHFLQIDQNMEIKVTQSESIIKMKNIDYEYNFTDYISNRYNLISISSVIDLINDIKAKVIDGDIKLIEKDGYRYTNINLKSEISKVKNIEIKYLVEDNSLIEINMLDNEKNPRVIMNINKFEVKK